METTDKLQNVTHKSSIFQPRREASSLLEKYLVDARQGGNRRKSAVYRVVHEHFEPISNAVWRDQRVFQQPASPCCSLRL
jgi:hypothetical protein